MTVRSVIIPSAASHHAPARCILAIELSLKSWVVAMQTPLADKISLHKLKAGNVGKLLELIERVRRRVEAKLCGPVEVHSCYEAGYDGFWLHRVLRHNGIENHVIDPASLQVSRRARRAKTDRIDAQRLLRVLSAYLRGDAKEVSVVRVPSPEEEDGRRLTRERERLINERVAHVNRIKGLCAVQGIYDYEPMRRDRFKRLEGLQTGDGRPLPPRLKVELVHELQRLELVLRTLVEVEAERDALVAKPEPGDANGTKMQALAKLKGIAAELSSGLVTEVFYRSFDNRRQVGGYVGLSPSPFCSGGMNRDQGISKAGNPRARKRMIELAWLWLRHQPDSALSIWFRERAGTTKGRLRRILIVAMARKLIVALWRYLSSGIVPTGAILKA
jgi:transposase